MGNMFGSFSDAKIQKRVADSDRIIRSKRQLGLGKCCRSLFFYFLLLLLFYLKRTKEKKKRKVRKGGSQWQYIPWALPKGLPRCLQEYSLKALQTGPMPQRAAKHANSKNTQGCDLRFSPSSIRLIEKKKKHSHLKLPRELFSTKTFDH